MKINLPTTANEVHIPDGMAIVTKTDLKGVITFANDDFCRISGFTQQELFAQSHNVVRHPDMPQEAFADLWRTLKAGLPWSGLVKNRCKNGDFYWVKAFVAPIQDDGVIQGYLSSRIRPDPEEIKSIAPIYADMRQGISPWILRGGLLEPKNPLKRFLPWTLFDRISVRSKLAVLLAFFVASLSVLGFVSNNGLKTVRVGGPLYEQLASSKDLVADILPPPTYLIESWLTTLELAQASGSNKASMVTKLDALEKEFHRSLTHWEGTLPSGALHNAMLNDVGSTGKAFLELQQSRFIKPLQAGQLELAVAALPELKAAYEKHRVAVDATVVLAKQHGDDIQLMVSDSTSQQFSTLLLTFLFVLVLFASMILLLQRSLNKSLGADPKYVSEIIRHLAAGNMGIYIKEHGSNSQSLLTCLRTMQVRMREYFGLMQSSAHNIASAAGQVSESARSVCDASLDQQMQASELSAGASRVVGGVCDVAQSALTARELSEHSGDSCEAGARVIYQSVESMTRIAETVNHSAQRIAQLGEDSEKIASVVQVIREIANQTNLLALNAAIEAARAGESGRGFAVVADEVRKLAERTSSATLEISEIISGIQSSMNAAGQSMNAGVAEVSVGVDLARGAGGAIDELKGSTRDVAELIGAISCAMSDQTTAVKDITSALDNIVIKCNENMQEASEAAGAAFALRDAATRLSEETMRFAI